MSTPTTITSSLITLSNSILFVDIETVPQTETLSSDIWDLYSKRFFNTTDLDLNEHYEKSASFYAEFAKICCVSIGQLYKDNKFYVKSICSQDEAYILTEFAKVISKPDVIWLAGHNIREFDLPFLFRRMIVNGIQVPNILKVDNKKTWEYPYHDTMDLWSHTQWKYKVSLDLLAKILGIPSSKKEMSGADVAGVYYFPGFNGKDVDGSDLLPFDLEDRRKDALAKIAKYGAGDIVTSAQVYCALKGITPLRTDQIYFL